MNQVKAGSRPIRHAGGVFAEMHGELMGSAGGIDFAAFDASRYPDELIARARSTWQGRVLTEYRSIQIMTRFLTEVLGAGDPIEVYAGASDLVADEIRHTALCASMVEALGGTPRLPEPLVAEENPGFLKMSMPQRALVSAINMLAINETLSVGFVEDLNARCKDPVVKAVLAATCEDEEGHQDFGWSYVERSLERFPADAMGTWREVVQQTLAPHRRSVDRTLAEVPASERDLDAWPDAELVDLGLFSPQRQALVWQRTFQQKVAPRLMKLGLL